MKYHGTILAALAALVSLSMATGDFCSLGSTEIDGNWFCQAVTAIQYTNVGFPGSYNQITDMPPNGECSSVPINFNGPLSPLDGEVSVHFRGPLQLKQFAAYTPSSTNSKTKRARSDSFAHRKGHKHSHHKKHADFKDQMEKRQEWVTATIDGNIVSWTMGNPNPEPTAKTVSAEPPAPVMVTAVIDGKVVSWTNNYFGPSSTPPAATTIKSQQTTATVHVTEMAPTRTTTVTLSQITNYGQAVATTLFTTVSAATQAADMITATINGNVVSWSNNYYGAPANPTLDNVVEALAVSGLPSTQAQPISKTSYPTSSSLREDASYDKVEVYTRIGYYDSVSQTLDNLVFLGNHGGEGSGVVDLVYGASLSYINSAANGGAEGPTILEDCTLPSNTEVVIMHAAECSENDCGYFRPGSVAHHGFDGADKIFLLEFAMPHDTSSDLNNDMPSIWLLNAQIPRTLQYGSANCSCWTSGCGEFDIAEAVNPGSTFLKSTLHTNTPGGDSDYIARPTESTMKLAVIFDASVSTIHIQVLDDSTQFTASMSMTEVEQMCSSSGGKTSTFAVAT
ncbi:hypothetical protein BP5796_03253 [Coleophoma crateriformis]|uniref:glucan endo-1,3-beta-D-glucosidase n=1 Tax=Coleophoma crateriformis TaxID=565419 RepID=A0A3D8SMI7_9HELO|nr:hypothetical protein BP5796_03253 [Coleophoma crateriformis]